MRPKVFTAPKFGQVSKISAVKATSFSVSLILPPPGNEVAVKAFLTNFVRVHEGHLGFTNIFSFISSLPERQDGSNSLGRSFPLLFLDFFHQLQSNRLL